MTSDKFGIPDPAKVMAQVNAIVSTRFNQPAMGEDPVKIALFGDWHGNGSWAERAIEYAVDKGADVGIQLGDFGFWRKGGDTETFLARVSKAVRNADDFRFFWLPGNHEDYSREDEFSSWDTLTYLPRGFRWSWWDKKFMAVGGAWSIDRFMRKEGVSYWNEELLTDEQLAYTNREPHGLDVIFTHDCPTGINIPGIGPDSKPRGGKDLWPPDMLAGAREHRLKMRQIWETHHPQRWYHGHYHVFYDSIWYGPTRFFGLDCDGASGGMTRHVAFLTQGDLK